MDCQPHLLAVAEVGRHRVQVEREDFQEAQWCPAAGYEQEVSSMDGKQPGKKAYLQEKSKVRAPTCF